MENSINSVHFLPFMSVFQTERCLVGHKPKLWSKWSSKHPFTGNIIETLVIPNDHLFLYIVLCLEKKFTLTIYGHCFHSSWESGREMHFWGDFFSLNEQKSLNIYYILQGKMGLLVSCTNMWQIKGKTLDLWRSKGPVLLLGHFSGCTSPLGWIAHVSINAMFFWVIRFILWWNISSSN